MTATKSRRLAREITDEVLGPMHAELIVSRGATGTRITRAEIEASIIRVLLTPKPQQQREKSP